jgi:hypothetical protein
MVFFIIIPGSNTHMELISQTLIGIGAINAAAIVGFYFRNALRTARQEREAAHMIRRIKEADFKYPVHGFHNGDH